VDRIERSARVLIAAMIARYVHIILGITWFGGTVYRSLIVLPGLTSLTRTEGDHLLRVVQERHETWLLTVGCLVIGMGILLGTVVGPIQTSDDLLSLYGLTWASSLLLGTALLIWEIFAVSPVTSALLNAPEAHWIQYVYRVKLLCGIEAGGFGVLLVGMISMHFGY
jgi:hypothetical protein